MSPLWRRQRWRSAPTFRKRALIALGARQRALALEQKLIRNGGVISP